MPHFQNKSNSTKVHGQFRRFLLCHCHSHSTIQIPRFIGTPNAGSANEQLSFYAFPHSTTTDCDQRHSKILIATTKVQGSSWLILVGCTYVVLRNCIGSQDTAKKMPNSYKPENFVFSRKFRESRYEKEAEFYPIKHLLELLFLYLIGVT